MSIRYRDIFIVFFLLILFQACTDKDSSNSGYQRTTEQLEIDSLIDTANELALKKVEATFRQAEGMAQEAIKKADQINYTKGKGVAYRLWATIEYDRGHYDKALEYNNKAIEFVNGQDPLTEMLALLSIGDIYREKGKNIVAQDYFLKALALGNKVNDNRLMGLANNKLGKIFYWQSKWDLAQDHFKASLKFFLQASKNREYLSRIEEQYGNIGLTYMQQHKYDTALIYYDSSLEVAKGLDAKSRGISEGVVAGNTGHLYQLNKQYNKAIPLLKKNIRINDRPGYDQGDALSSYVYLLQIYNTLDSVQQFENTLDSVMRLIELPLQRRHRMEVYRLQADFNRKRGDFEAAYLFTDKFIKLRDSIESAVSQESMAEMLYRYELLEQKNITQMLEKENEIKKVQTLTITIITLLAFVLLSASLIGVFKYRKTLRRQEQLTEEIKRQNSVIKLNKMDLEQAIDELKQMNAEKNKILGVVAHDLRSPINSIIGISNLLGATLNEPNPNIKELNQYMEMIGQSCDNALAVIQELLEVAQMEAQGGTLDKELVNLNDLVQQVTDMYLSKAAQKQINFTVNSSENFDVLLNREKFRRVLNNLVSNAIKYSNLGGRIFIKTAREGDKVLISVKDEGIGIKPEMQGMVFEKFTRAKRPGTAGEPTVGLGMSIVKQIVEAHGGRIWLESEPVSGTTFFIEIPG